jgi:hypothetical protein
MKSAAVTLTTSPTLLIAADDQNRICYLHSTSGSSYLGDSSVTSSSGLHLPNNQTIEIHLPLGETLYGVAGSGTTNVRVLTPDSD